HAPRRLAFEQTLRERTAASGKEPHQLEQIHGPQVKRGAEGGKREHQYVQQLSFHLRMPAGELAPGAVVPGAAEARRVELGDTRDASVAAIQSRVTTLELGVEPCDPEGFEPELSECGAGSTKREKSSAHIMQVAGQREFLRAERTARPALVRFQHQYSESALREYTRCHEPIWARTDH